MRIQIAAIGRMKAGPERELVSRYLDRANMAGRALGLSGPIVHEHPESRAGTAALRRTEEARALAAHQGDGLLVALDERGELLDSPTLAARIARWRDDGRPLLTFAIGGADGLTPELLAGAALRLSFSPLTWPHQLVRIMLAEQLYRTMTLLSGHPYHRGE